MCWGFNMDWRILVFYPEPETTEDGNLYLRLRKMSHTIYVANGKVIYIHRRMC